MPLAEQLPLTHTSGDDPLSPAELTHIAFMGQGEIAHGILRSIPPERRPMFANKFVLAEVIAAGIRKLRTFLAASAEGEAMKEKDFIDEIVHLFVVTAKEQGTYPRELFESLLLWAEELKKLSLLREALTCYDLAQTLGINKFPQLNVRCLLGKGNLLSVTGKRTDTETLLASLTERPYLIADRNLLPYVYFALGQESLVGGNASLYKRLLFRALRQFSTQLETRRMIVDQITKTYRHFFKVLLDRHVSIPNKFLYVIHRLLFGLVRFRVARVLGMVSAVKYAVLGYVYALNYVLRPAPTLLRANGEHHRSTTEGVSASSSFLITRAMGGIGDFLMMTPALHALRQKYPRSEIVLAIPKRYFPLFQGNADVRLSDIENEQLDLSAYTKWFNFTDCPAARVEARTAPKVKLSRIEVFARSLGIGWLRRMRMDKRPRYVLTPEDRAFQRTFWREHDLDGKIVLAVQLHADEVYRDYPYMKDLIHRLARAYHVLVFDTETIDECEGERIVKVEKLPIREAFALASGCSLIVAPDSAFVHLAAAFEIPCVALYGPVDGEVRTKHYPKCVYLDVRQKLGCVPCWRNDQIPCALTGLRTSACLADIAIDDICTTVHSLLAKEHTA